MENVERDNCTHKQQAYSSLLERWKMMVPQETLRICRDL